MVWGATKKVGFGAFVASKNQHIALHAAILLRQYDPARLAKVGFLGFTLLGLKKAGKSLIFRFLRF